MKTKTHHPDAHQVICTAGTPPPAWRRTAFTLTELVVSVGILGLMMAMVGTVFKLTIDSTGEATSLTEITQSLRLLEETLRQDLAQIPQNPGETMSGAMMVIQANVINAYWRTEYAELDVEDQDPSTGYPHDPDPERETTNLDSAGRPIPELPRADVLMFFTSAEGKKSFRSNPYPAIEAKMAQVVYGHAELGELDSTGAWPPAGPPSDFDDFFTGTITVFPTAAGTWHLARRTVLLVDQPEEDLDQYDPNWISGSNDIPDTLDDSLGTDPWDPSYSVSNQPLYDGLVDLVDNAFVYDVEVSARQNLTSPSSLLNGAWFARPRLDLTPPTLQAQRLGAYLLPHCASFKVEWALDLRDFKSIPFSSSQGQPDSPPAEFIWFDPANPTPFSELNDLANRYLATGDADAASVAVALTGTFKPQLVGRFPNPSGSPPSVGDAPIPVWFGNDDMNYEGSEDEPDRFFPKALRITVDVYDDSGRFRRPIRQVMVLPVGGG